MNNCRFAGRCKLKAFLKKQLGYLLFGIIIWLPVAVISIIGNWAFKALDDTGQNILGPFSLGRTMPAGVGFITMVFLLWLSGILLKKTCIRNFVAKIPILGSLLGGNGKGQTMSIERLLGLQPCLFLFSPTCPDYGFILSEISATLDGKTPVGDFLNVYYPNVPTLIMGQVFAVRKETVIKLGNSAAEIIGLLLYASRSPEYLKYLLWPNETMEQFREREKKFGR